MRLFLNIMAKILAIPLTIFIRLLLLPVIVLWLVLVIFWLLTRAISLPFALIFGKVSKKNKSIEWSIK